MTTVAVQSALALDGPPDPELVRIRDLVYQVAGIFHPDNKLRLLLDRCGRRMKELKTRTCASISNASPSSPCGRPNWWRC